MAQLGRALEWGSRGHRFKSCRPEFNPRQQREQGLREETITMDEKRKASRIEKVLVAQYSEDEPEVTHWDSTSIKNISTEGILLCTNKNFTKDQVLVLRFKIPFDPSHWLNAKGKVIESFQCKTRLRFIELNEEQKKIIRDYVDWFVKNNPTG